MGENSPIKKMMPVFQAAADRPRKEAEQAIDEQQKGQAAQLSREENMRRRRMVNAMRGLRVFRGADTGRQKARAGSVASVPAAAPTVEPIVNTSLMGIY